MVVKRMFTPSADDFARLVDPKETRVQAIPVYAEISADLDTPVSAFLRASRGPYSFLLESAEGGERWGRYSFIGMDPAFIVRATGTRCELIENGAVVRAEDRSDPLTFLEEQMARFTIARVPGLPRFAGGAVGWFGYDAVRWWERLPDARVASAKPFPTLVFAVPQTLLIFDNLRHRIQVVRIVFARGVDPRTAHADAERRIEELITKMRGPLPARPGKSTLAPAVEAIHGADAYKRAVGKIKEYIAAGDCIQVVPSHRFRVDYDGSSFDLYRALRTVNPSPYMFYLNYPEVTVSGASPEVLVRVEDGEMMVAPIAGTRKRGKTDDEDKALEKDLLSDPKELAEHVMLVDLARNDLGRVGAVGSVRVDNFMHVQRYSHVMHIVSEVRARLAPDKTSYDAIRSAFPAGTLSGAPKVRAMQIIDELEPHSRELYGGAVGYVGFDGNVDLSIAIRTAWRRDGVWNVQVGAGIVADSDPDAEYEETVNKAGAVLRALEVAKADR
jgi:anthranilate synthase component 1